MADNKDIAKQQQEAATKEQQEKTKDWADIDDHEEDDQEIGVGGDEQ